MIARLLKNIFFYSKKYKIYKIINNFSQITRRKIHYTYVIYFLEIEILNLRFDLEIDWNKHF